MKTLNSNRTGSRFSKSISCLSRLLMLGLVLACTSAVLFGSVPPQLVSSRDFTLLSPAGGNGESVGASVTPDGRFLLFTSTASDLVAGLDQRQVIANVFLHDRASNTTALVSATISGTGGGNSHSLSSQVSTNSRYVLFESDASDLVAGDTNGYGDVFLRDLQTGIIQLVSVATDGGGATRRSYDSVMTPDGRYVAFVSAATNLVAGDTNTFPHLFVRDMNTGTTTLVTNDALPQARVVATQQISPDGRFVVFFASSNSTFFTASDAPNGDVYVRDLLNGTTTWASTNGAAILVATFGPVTNTLFCHPSMSDDGRYIAFTGGTNASGQTLVLLFDQVAGTTSTATTNAIGTTPQDDTIYGPRISADGRYVAYVEPAADGSNSNIRVWDAVAGTNILVSGDAGGIPVNAICHSPVVTSNGQFVAFLSNATNLVGNAVSTGFHAYLRDLLAGTTQLVDADTNGFGSANIEGTLLSLSDDGRFVAFNSPDGQLVDRDSNNAQDVFLRDTIAGTNELISARNPFLTPIAGNGLTRLSPYSISADGRWLAFDSTASDLVPGDTNGYGDVFVRDLWTGQVTLVSAGMDGNPALGGQSSSGVISGNGRFVVFVSSATNIISAPLNRANIFRRDLYNGTTALVSVSTNGVDPALADCFYPSVSSDGRYVGFASSALNLVTGVTNNTVNIFRRDVNLGATTVLNMPVSPVTTVHFVPSMSADGRFMTYLPYVNSTNRLRVRDFQLGTDIYTNTIPSVLEVRWAVLSPDGSRILYGFTGSSSNVVRADRISPRTNLLSFPSKARFQSFSQFSSDGRYVVFIGGTNSASNRDQIYLCDLVTSNITLVSFNATNSGFANARSDSPVISGNGQTIVYRSYATDIVGGDTNPVPKIFIYDRLTGQNLIACAGQTNSEPFPWVSAPVMSVGAENVAFGSVGSDLTPGDLNRVPDAFAVRLSIRLQISPATSPGEATITWQAVADRTYEVQYKDELSDSLWTHLSATVSIVGNLGSVNVPPDQSHRFYRLIETE